MSSDHTTQSLNNTPQVAAFAHYTGISLGRRERRHSQLRTIAEVTIDRVIEPVTDLAIADRVAFVLAYRSGATHLVIAATDTYLICSTVEQLSSADISRIVQHAGAPRIVSIATPDGICPLLTMLTAQEVG